MELVDREHMLKKHANTFIALFALIVLLLSQVAINVYGEASPVTCVVITNPVETKPVPNYTVIVNPQNAKVIPGSTITFDVTVLSKGNITDVISLGVLGLPEGISTAFAPAKGTPSFTSKLTMSVDEMLCPGIYSPTIIAQNTNLQLAEIKLEVVSAGSVRKAMENKIAELGSRIDDLERTIKENQSNSFAGYISVLMVAIIGSFLLGAFALFVLLRHLTKNSKASNDAKTSSDVKLQEIIDLLKQLIETRKQTEAKPEVRSEVRQAASKEQPAAEPKVGDIWYAHCPTCDLRTEHSRDYEGVFCTRCGNRSS